VDKEWRGRNALTGYPSVEFRIPGHILVPDNRPRS
jgi:hypothetical protein